MKIHTQSVFDPWPMPDNSVQAIITSPPYYSLRRYKIPDVIIGGDKNCEHLWGNDFYERKRGTIAGTTAQTGTQKKGIGTGLGINQGHFCNKCGAWQGQHGLEPTYLLYIAHCKLWMQEAIRVLKDDGIIFVNIADTYAGSGGAGGDYNEGGTREGQEKYKQHQQNLSSKSKLLIPERFVIMCVDELGLISRNNICWHSTNKMPESAEDRFSKKWEYVFMFAKNQKYYFDLDAVREPHKTISVERLQRAVGNNHKYTMGADGQIPHGLSKPRSNRNRKGANTGENNKEPYTGNNPHRMRLYKGGDNIGREENLPVSTYKFDGGDYLVADLNPKGKNPGDVWEIPTQPSSFAHYAMFPEKLVKRMILCSSKPGDIILDPFCGSGTTLKVAEELNREGIGIDIGYQNIQKKRLHSIQKQLLI